MSDPLLDRYERELAAVRGLAAEFARQRPVEAGRLRMTPDAVEDPHVARLLEGVAFLAARVQQRLDDELPELSDTLLDMLAPGLLAPVPSMTTLRFTQRDDAAGAVVIERGQRVATEAIRGQPVRFATCFDVKLWPLRIENVRLSGLPFAAPAHPHAAGAASCLQISLRTTAEHLTMQGLGLDQLRLHLAGAPGLTGQLYELLAGSTLGVALATGSTDPDAAFLGPEAVRPVGFEPEEAVLHWPGGAFEGHRLLAEYFTFPPKFLYLDLGKLEQRTRALPGPALEVYVYLARPLPELERSIGPGNFLLGCTPAVNRFTRPCEPIGLDGTQSDWLVLPDARHPDCFEVCSIESVRESLNDASSRRLVPFHRLAERETEPLGARPPAAWLARRLPAPLGLSGTVTRIALRDPAFDPQAPSHGTLSIDAVCCNRDLPDLVPFGDGQPRLTLEGSSAPPIRGVECLSKPTPTLRPLLRERSAWQLLSHLALNHLSLSGGAQAALALREMLRLHALPHAQEARAAAVDALLAVDATPGIARLPDHRPGAFARGVDVTLTFEAQAWRAGGLYLLAAVLERFLALQVSVNAFVRTRAVLRGRAAPVASWPPRSGTRVLL